MSPTASRSLVNNNDAPATTDEETEAVDTVAGGIWGH